ncbi:MAG: hypothetical protein ACLFV8_10850 [Alphaproteobacteria bacterium]
MGAEVIGIFPFLLIPVAAVLIEMAYTDRSRRLGQGTLGLGRGRLARGLLAALGIMIPYSAVHASLDFFERVNQGPLEASAYWDTIPGWLMIDLGIHTFTQLLFLTIFGTPLFWLFYRLRFASLAGVIVIALLISAGWAGETFLDPYNLWCERHLKACVTKQFVNFSIPTLLTAVAFSFGAGLPLVKGVRRSTD